METWVSNVGKPIVRDLFAHDLSVRKVPEHVSRLASPGQNPLSSTSARFAATRDPASPVLTPRPPATPTGVMPPPPPPAAGSGPPMTSVGGWGRDGCQATTLSVGIVDVQLASTLTAARCPPTSGRCWQRSVHPSLGGRGHALRDRPEHGCVLNPVRTSPTMHRRF